MQYFNCKSRVSKCFSESSFALTKTTAICMYFSVASPKVLTISARVLTISTRVLTISTRVLTISTRVLTISTRVLTISTRVLTISTRVLTISTRVLTISTRVLTISTRVLTISTRVLTIEGNKDSTMVSYCCYCCVLLSRISLLVAWRGTFFCTNRFLDHFFSHSLVYFKCCISSFHPSLNFYSLDRSGACIVMVVYQFR